MIIELIWAGCGHVFLLPCDRLLQRFRFRYGFDIA
jgi:hypothetical protein